VFDKVKENTKRIHGGSRATYSEAANLALNQTLVRSINTSIVALLPVLSILVVGVSLLGVGTLNDLALALFVGMLVGTYSSIFVATPFLCQIKERRAENIALAKRVNARRKNGDVVEDAKPAVTIGAPIVSSSGPRQQQVKKPRSRRSSK
jgi:preprotein translocase subunit SecF